MLVTQLFAKLAFQHSNMVMPFFKFWFDKHPFQG